MKIEVLFSLSTMAARRGGRRDAHGGQSPNFSSVTDPFFHLHACSPALFPSSSPNGPLPFGSGRITQWKYQEERRGCAPSKASHPRSLSTGGTGRARHGRAGVPARKRSNELHRPSRRSEHLKPNVDFNIGVAVLAPRKWNVAPHGAVEDCWSGLFLFVHLISGLHK